jgi:hypothetical protein
MSASSRGAEGSNIHFPFSPLFFHPSPAPRWVNPSTTRLEALGGLARARGTPARGRGMPRLHNACLVDAAGRAAVGEQAASGKGWGWRVRVRLS